MGFAARAIFQDETKHKTRLPQNDCIERIVNSAVPENTQKATQFGMSVFNGRYMVFSMLCSKILSRNTVSSSPV